MLFARASTYGYFIVDENGLSVGRDGFLAYIPVPCGRYEYPRYKEPKTKRNIWRTSHRRTK